MTKSVKDIRRNSEKKSGISKRSGRFLRLHLRKSGGRSFLRKLSGSRRRLLNSMKRSSALIRISRLSRRSSLARLVRWCSRSNL